MYDVRRHNTHHFNIDVDFEAQKWGLSSTTSIASFKLLCVKYIYMANLNVQVAATIVIGRPHKISKLTLRTELET